MTELVLGDDANVAAWVVSQLRRPISFDPPFYAIGIVKDGEPVAGVVYHNFREDSAAFGGVSRVVRSIEASIASTTPHWCNRFTLNAVLRYPFVQLDCNRMTALTHKRNKRARLFLKRLGFVEEGILREFFARDDGVVYGLLRRDAQRWMEKKHEQGRLLAASGS